MPIQTIQLLTVDTVYDADSNAHVATLDASTGSEVDVEILVERFLHERDLDELFLYNFDRDGNCIEFAFAEKEPAIRKTRRVRFFTDPLIHRPPFRLQITHQLESVCMKDFSFRITYQALDPESNV
jgi:hypothetical protein